MSSWIPTQKSRKLPVNLFYCKTSPSGYGSNFFNFFFCYLFARSKQKALYLNDTRNNISSDYHLILDTFETLPGIILTKENGNTLQQMHPVEMKQYYESLTDLERKKAAREVFRFRSSLQEQINKAKQTLPPIDYGIHIRTGDKITTGEMKAISLASYVEATKAHQTKIKKDKLSIYLMTDSLRAFEEFKANADPSWTVYRLPSPIETLHGHVQSVYNEHSPDQKLEAFVHFLTEVQVLAQSEAILCTFSSNIGRFVELLTDSPIQSLD